MLSRASITGRLQILPEQEYGPKKARKRSVDWIVSDEHDAIFIECKAKRVSWEAKTELIVLSNLTANIESLGSSVVQVYKTLRDYLNGHYPHFPFRNDRKIYPLVVTLENWRLFGPALADMLSSAVRRQMNEANLPEEWMTEFPYSVMATDEAESIFQVIDSTGIADFLDGKLHSPEMAGWEWTGYARSTKPGFPYRALFKKEYQEIFSRLLGADAESQPEPAEV